MKCCFTILLCTISCFIYAQKIPLSFYKSDGKTILKEKKLSDSLLNVRQSFNQNFLLYKNPQFNMPVLGLDLSKQKITDSTNRYQIWVSPIDKMRGIQPLASQSFSMPNALFIPKTIIRFF